MRTEAGITVSTSTVVSIAPAGAPPAFVVVEGMEPFHALTPGRARELAAELLAAADRVDEKRADARAAGLLRFPSGGKAR